jgi:hypothetical protein
MTQEVTSFVLRFVREVSEEQGARWRGLVQHVQSGTEQSFATFTDAVQFMQGLVVESTVQALEREERMTEKNPFADITSEMTKMWGDLGPRMAEMWTQAAEQMMSQSASFRSQVDRAVAASLKTWGPSTDADQDEVLTALTRLNEQFEALMVRVEALEAKVEAEQAPPKRRRTSRRATTEAPE